MSAKKTLLSVIYDKKWFILALILSTVLFGIVFTYLGMTQKPVESINVGNTDWEFSLADGTKATPEENGVFTLPEANSTLFCTLSLEKYADTLTTSALIGITSRTSDVAVLADGVLIADPTHRFDEVTGSFSDGKPSGSGIFSLGTAKELTLAVRFVSPEASLKALPSVTIYPEQYAYTSVYLTQGAKAALPAGVFLAISAALLLLYLFGLYNKNSNADVLLLSVVSLSFFFLETIPFGIYVVWLLQTPFITYTLRLIPTLVLLWILWHRCSGKIRRFGWIYPLICTVAVAVGILWRQIDIVQGNKYTNLLQGKLLPLAMLLALIVCVIEAFKGNIAYRRFFSIGCGLAVITGFAALISFNNNGELWNGICGAFGNTKLLGFFEPLQLFNKFLLLLLFFSAAYDFVMQTVRRNAELQALTLKNAYVTENAALLRRSLDETYGLRHEMKHHIDSLAALCESGDLERVSGYVKALSGDYCKEPGRYSDHALINALVSSCAKRAKEIGADFEASVQVPEVIGIDDADIAVVLSNMIDNAIEALTLVADEKDRRLSLKAAIFEDTGLFISCINTFEGERKQDEAGAFISTKSDKGHGVGLKAMQRVAEKYNSIILPEIEGNTFHIKTYLYFKK